MPETRKYKVISPLDWDGKRQPIGAEVELSAEVAKDLLGHTVVPASDALTDGQVAQAVDQVKAQAVELEDWRQSLMAQEAELRNAREALDKDEADLTLAQEALLAAQSDLKAAQDKLAAERAEFEAKAAPKAAKK